MSTHRTQQRTVLTVMGMPDEAAWWMLVVGSTGGCVMSLSMMNSGPQWTAFQFV
jgi:hypothetical protein